jgi:multicomponent Na+:H+ antiporter subunit E
MFSEERKIKLKRLGPAAAMFVLLMIFWIILTGTLDLPTVLIGAGASLLVVWFNANLLFGKDETSKVSFKTLFAFLKVMFVVLIEVVKSNIHVAMIVLKKKMPIDPGFVVVRNPLKKAWNQALYANAITLTPGTLTVDVVEEGILVHGLVKSEVKGIEDSKMERAFRALEE